MINPTQLRCNECDKTVGKDDVFCGFCEARQVCVYCDERDCDEHTPDENDVCSSCGRRAFDTAGAGNACGCEDGQDGWAKWKRPGTEKSK